MRGIQPVLPVPASCRACCCRVGCCCVSDNAVRAVYILPVLAMLSVCYANARCCCAFLNAVSARHTVGARCAGSTCLASVPRSVFAANVSYVIVFCVSYTISVCYANACSTAVLAAAAPLSIVFNVSTPNAYSARCSVSARHAASPTSPWRLPCLLPPSLLPPCLVPPCLLLLPSL